MNTHLCIKCNTQYTSNDEDAYYCVSCEIEKKKIADEVDARIGTSPRTHPKSDLQIYDEAPKVHGFPRA